MNFPVHRNTHVLQAQEVMNTAGVSLANPHTHASKFGLVSDYLVCTSSRVILNYIYNRLQNRLSSFL